MMDRENQSVNRNSSLRSIGISIFTAFFIYILEIFFVFAFTALIYSGELSSQIPRAMGFIIFGDALLCAIVSTLTSYPGFIGVEQDTPGAMLSVIAVGIITALAGKQEMQFATVTLMVVITTSMTSILLLGLGYFKLGGLARFLPYPVIGGFLAGTGWLLIQGGIGIMADSSAIADWLQPNLLALWIPGVLLGIGIYVISQKISKPYIVPLIMVIASLLFYGVIRVLGVSMADLRAAGWLLNANISSTIWEFPLSSSFLSQVDWHLLLAQLPSLIPIAIISVIALLLNSSGMEVLVRKDIDLNRELLIAGLGNFAAGLTGGLIGFQDLSFASLNYAMTGGKRLVGIVTALLLGATMFVGTSVILYVPKFVFGSVLIFIGLQLLVDWVYEAWFKFSRIEFGVVVCILLVLAFSGVLQAVIAGLILAVVMFVVSYSQVNVIKFAFSGRDFRSRVSHPLHEQQVLDTHGSKLYIMKLEGFIFFGTASAIVNAIRQRARVSLPDELKYCLMDFSKVSGIDSTGMLSFNRMLQWSQEQAVTLIFAGLAPALQQKFLQESTDYSETVQFLPNLDRGLEWCENEIIKTYLADLQIKKDILTQLNEILKDDCADKLVPYLHHREYRAGEYLIREGDTPDFIYFVQSGQVTVQLEAQGKEPIRLETMYSGRTVGEIAFYLGTQRTASVIADLDTVVYSLSISDLKNMETADPEAANLFHRINVLLLSERVMHTTRTVRALEQF